MTRYMNRIYNGDIFEPVPVEFAINQISWNPYHEEAFVTFADGTPVRTNHIIYDYPASMCLRNLRIKGSGDLRMKRLDNMIIVSCDNIEFECMSPKAEKPTEHKIQACLERMRDGKCPYKLARYLYTNIPSKKPR